MRKRILIALFSFLFCLPAQAYLPSDPYYSQQNYLKQINIENAWEKAKGNGVIVAVLDSGVDINHPDLKMNIWRNDDEIPNDGVDNDRNGFIDDVNGWDFVNNVPDPSPKFDLAYNSTAINHGTAIAGLIGAVANNGEGITGIAFYSKIMPIRVLDGEGSGDVENLVKAIEYAVNNGANVINLSLVGYDFSANLSEAVQWASGKGVTVVASAGNADAGQEGIDLDITPAYPACYGDDNKNNWVTAVSSVDANDIKSSFANYGLGCIDLTAPGEGIMSLAYHNSTDPQFNDYYSFNWDGTSFSTALVSGVAALIKSKDLSAMPSQISSALLKNSDDIDDKNLSYFGQLGQGRLNAASALNADLSPAKGYLAKLANSTAVYYVNEAGERWLFSNEATYWSWYDGVWKDQNVKVISQDEFNNLKPGNNVVARPGSLIKFENSPRVYAVSPATSLCRVETEAGPILYGADWQKKIITIQDGFENNYNNNLDCILAAGSKYSDGALIQYRDSADIWYVEAGKKRKLSDASFVANNFKNGNIIKNVSANIAYEPGRPISGWEGGIFPYNK